ncbi:MAG: hypothetical protein K2X93_18795 [Candidatus Obscuribacterales bacterium]|nr:hypothetical protein [Candidatus Obscuribacterales bacterium]
MIYRISRRANTDIEAICDYIGKDSQSIMVSSAVAESRKTTTTLLDHDAWITVRLLHFREEKSKSWIAEHLGISRNTVAKYLREPDPPEYRLKMEFG